MVMEILLPRFGREGWWPAESPFEAAVGAILTQNTNWRNVEKAIGNLKGVVSLTPTSLLSLHADQLETLIRPAGFYKQKAERLKALSKLLSKDFGGEVERLGSIEMDRARSILLGIKGIGRETADAILLYACHLPSFVVDAYTFRMLRRLQIREEEDYEEVRELFHNCLGRNADILSLAHAAIVEFSKQICTKSPLCSRCPIYTLCPFPSKQKKRRSEQQDE
ncbi:MAG: hypothetical protein QXP70_00955 [Methanomassiliicoccales archaeon]